MASTPFSPLSSASHSHGLVRRFDWRRHIADLLSLSNLTFGVLCIGFALHDQYVAGLSCIVLGALCDGLDGAAARRYGGTRWGVLADDVADAITYGLAPAVAIAWYLRGTEGVVLGLGFFLLTLTRLVHFTLNKGSSDPAMFQGVPSTVGGLTVLSALIVWTDHPLLVGVAVGAISVKLVAFSTQYPHAGRWFLGLPRRWWWLASALALFVGAMLWMAPVLTATALLLSVLVYGLWPNVQALTRSCAARRTALASRES